MNTTTLQRRPLKHESNAAREILSWLLVMPLLDRSEIELLAEWSATTVTQTLRRLQAQGLVSSVPSSLPGLPTTARFYLTAAGIEAVARTRDTQAGTLLRRYPVSAHHINLLLSRLDTVAALYRVTTLVADATTIRGFRWLRKHPLDAVIEMDGGKALGVMREGRFAPPSHLRRRLWSLVRSPHPDTVLVLAPDIIRLRDWRRPLGRSPLTGFLALEEELMQTDTGAPLWHAPSDPEPWPLSRALQLVKGGTVPQEPSPAHLHPPEPDLAQAARRWASSGGVTPHTAHYLPVALAGAAKQLMTTIGLWPYVTMPDLSGIAGLTKARLLQVLDLPLRLGLVLRVRHGGRVRYVVSDRGLRFLARAERLANPAVLLSWSPSLRDPKAALSWRNVKGSRTRRLLRDIEHTAAVHRFLGALARQARAEGGRAVLLEPPHHAARRYQADDGTQAAIAPDAYGLIERDGEPFHFFLEWERRAAHPGLLRAKLSPYLRYYQSRRPADDYGAYPTLLVVLRDEIVESHFLAIVRESNDTVLGLRVLASHVEEIDANGPLSAAWRTRMDQHRTGP